MLPAILTLPVLLSFVIATIWVSASTVLAERFGTKIGGVISTLPSTIIIALFFMSVDNGALFASEAAIVVPAEMGVNTIFLALFITLIGKGLGKAIAGALTGWFGISFIIYLAEPRSILLSLVLFILFVIIALLWLKRGEEHRQQPGKKVRYTPAEILFRGVFAGAVIALSVLMASLAGPMVGAIFSVFPAIFISTMTILYLRQGSSFTGATGKTMILGSSNVVSYAVVAHYAFPAYGAAIGTIISIILSYIWSFGAFLLIQRYQN